MPINFLRFSRPASFFDRGVPLIALGREVDDCLLADGSECVAGEKECTVKEGCGRVDHRAHVVQMKRDMVILRGLIVDEALVVERCLIEFDGRR
jgi:hypothetical protein